MLHMTRKRNDILSAHYHNIIHIIRIYAMQSTTNRNTRTARNLNTDFRDFCVAAERDALKLKNNRYLYSTLIVKTTGRKRLLKSREIRQRRSCGISGKIRSDIKSQGSWSPGVKSTS